MAEKAFRVAVKRKTGHVACLFHRESEVIILYYGLVGRMLKNLAIGGRSRTAYITGAIRHLLFNNRFPVQPVERLGHG